MRLEDREESENVEDRRGFGTQAGMAVGGGGLLLAIVLLVLGVDPRKVQQIVAPPPQQGQVNQQGGPPRPVDPEEEKQAHFTKVIFGDTERIWGELFTKHGKTYPNPTLVLYSPGTVDTACGQAESAVGPFYCPGDSKVYIDLSFYKDMERKLNAPGEFARAYVVAHEVGHHVQKLLGYTEPVDRARRGGNKVEINRMSVRLELQADYLAGVWAHYGEQKWNFLDPGDIDSALNAAYEIGDDRLEKKAQGYVVPDSFTHGTSKQRMRWFSQGFKTGDVGAARRAFDLDYEKL
jgi:predicted metalloprotease